MRSATIFLLLGLVACGPSLTPPTEDPVGSTVTTSVPATTATIDVQAMEVQDCSTPPVTFSALCEVYELLQTWHVDRPLGDDPLLASALGGLESFEVTNTEPRPRVLQCAIPTDEFAAFCEALAELVRDTGTAVGPAVEAAVLAMAGVDPFSYYVPPEQVGSFRETGLVGGVGLLLDATDSVGSKCARIAVNCRLEIVYVLDGNPGAHAGLAEGDVITAVDGVEVDGQRFAAVVSAVAGDETGVVELTVDRDGEVLVFDIQRAELVVPTVTVGLPSDGIGYLRIPDFEDDIPDLVHGALEELMSLGPSTIVIDLRGNPGGFLDSAVDVLSDFVDGETVLVTDGPGEHLEYPAATGGLATEPRLIVVVNRATASAAEIVAAALADTRDAIVVGTTTYGKDAVQIPFTLRNGGEMYVVVSRWTSPSGLSAAGGLIPDHEIEMDEEMSAEELVDRVLEVTG